MYSFRMPNLLCTCLTTLFLPSDPFAVKRNVARTVNSQQMFEYILHCFRTTYKYFALPLNKSSASKTEPKCGPSPGSKSKATDEEPAQASDLDRLSFHSQHAPHAVTAESLHEDSDCIIEEEVEQYSHSDEEREKEKVDPGKGSLSEEEEEDEEEDADIDMDALARHHLDSLTTEDEELFLVDEFSGEELLSDEEGPDLDTPVSMDAEEGGEGASGSFLCHSPLEEVIKEEAAENKNREKKLCYRFTKLVFTRGKVGFHADFVCPYL